MPPLVACAWLAWLAAAFRLYIPSFHLLALALVVWLVYVADGLLDARGRKGDSRGTVRRDFHAKHHRAFIVAVVLVVPILFWLVFFKLSGKLALAGMILSLWVLLYLIHAQNIRRARSTVLPKEIFAGFVFAMGIGLPLLEPLGLTMPDLQVLESMAMEGAGSLFYGLLYGTLALVGSIFFEPPIFLLGILFSTNCLMTGKYQETIHSGSVACPEFNDEASAVRVAPEWTRKTSLFPIIIVLSALYTGATYPDPGLPKVLGSVVFSAGLLLAGERLAQRRVVGGDGAGFLFDVALLLPPVLGLLVWA